jgi:hypothetical protein
MLEIEKLISVRTIIHKDLHLYLYLIIFFSTFML